MKQLTAVYKILKMLHVSMNSEQFDTSKLNHELYGVSETAFELLLIELQEKGYIKGLRLFECDGMQRPKVLLQQSYPTITLDGLEYLENNSTMKKVSDAVKGIIPIIK